MAGAFTILGVNLVASRAAQLVQGSRRHRRTSEEQTRAQPRKPRGSLDAQARARARAHRHREHGNGNLDYRRSAARTVSYRGPVTAQVRKCARRSAAQRLLESDRSLSPAAWRPGAVTFCGLHQARIRGPAMGRAQHPGRLYGDRDRGTRPTRRVHPCSTREYSGNCRLRLAGCMQHARAWPMAASTVSGLLAHRSVTRGQGAGVRIGSGSGIGSAQARARARARGR